MIKLIRLSEIAKVGPKATRGMSAGQMARELVYYCLQRLSAAAVWAMAVKTLALILDRQIDLSDVLIFVGAAFGAELLMLLVKRVIAPRRSTDETTTDTNEGGEL